MDDAEVKRSISRRKVFRGMLGGAAAAWSVPLVTTPAPAFAQGSPPPPSQVDKCGGDSDAALPSQLSPRFDEECPDGDPPDKCGGDSDAALPSQLSPQFGNCQ